MSDRAEKSAFPISPANFPARRPIKKQLTKYPTVQSRQGPKPPVLVRGIRWGRMPGIYEEISNVFNVRGMTTANARLIGRTSMQELIKMSPRSASEIQTEFDRISRPNFMLACEVGAVSLKDLGPGQGNMWRIDAEIKNAERLNGDSYCLDEEAVGLARSIGVSDDVANVVLQVPSMRLGAVRASDPVAAANELSEITRGVEFILGDRRVDWR